MNLNANLAEVVNGKDNNFNLLRFCAALAVIISHSFILSGNMPNAGPKILGFVAVNCFFIISGFLVCKSLLERKSIFAYAQARALRIYPALIIAVTFCALVIGPINTTFTLADYFADWQTYKFILTNGTLLGGGVENYLPGVFKIDQMDSKVNAPLWTLFYELYMYISLAIMALICGLGSNFKLKLFSRMMYFFSVTLLFIFVADIAYKYLPNHFISSMVRFGTMFAIGASLYLARDKIKLKFFLIVMMLVIIGLASLNRLAHNGITYLFLGYILLYLAYIPKGFLLDFNRLGDYSYGLYIFAYPIQQSLVNLFPSITTLQLFLFSLLITLIFAVFSWHLLESRMLKLKGY